MKTLPTLPFADLSTLHSAWDKVARNRGCAGGDGETIAQFTRRARAALPQLADDLRSGRYGPRDFRHVAVPKADGSTRPLAIPSVVDRIAMTAVAQCLDPYVDPMFSEDSYGYRKNRSVDMAAGRVSMLRRNGFPWVVEADIERCFEQVPHDRLMMRLEALLGARNADLTRLIGLWLAQGALEADTPGRGLAQGSPLSPLLANLYLDQLDETFEDGAVRLIRFADDFVLLARDEQAANDALERAEDTLLDLGLRLKAGKTAVRAFEDSFTFLGQLFIRGLTLPSRAAEEKTILAELRRIAEDDAGAEAAAQDVQPVSPRLLYLDTPGLQISRDRFSFAVKDGNDDLQMTVSHRRVDRIEVGPSVDLSTPALRLAMRTGVPISFSDGHGNPLGILEPAPQAGDATLHLAQARAVDDPDRCFQIAAAIVGARIANMRTRLHVLNRSAKDIQVIAATRDLGTALRKLATAKSVASLRGQEGAATAVYWPALGRLCAGVPKTFRRQRPARDPLNAAINYLTALLRRDVRAAVLRAGLHPGFGFLHRPSDKGDALVFDLMEGFRAMMTEGLAVSLFNRNRLRPEMFTTDDTTTRISAEGRRGLIKGYEAEARRAAKSPHTGQRHDARTRLYWEARALVKSLMVPDAPFVPGRQDS